MEFVATAAQMKEMDRRAIEEMGVPSLELMEHAAQGVADVVWELLHPAKEGYFPEIIGGSHSIAVLSKAKTPEEQEQFRRLEALAEEKNHDSTPWVGVLCGPGNNGGDGVAAARLLKDMGLRVRAFLVGDRAKMTPDQRAMEEKLKAAGGELEPFDPQDQEQMLWLHLCDCKVDALFGVGLCRPLEGDFSHAALMMQDSINSRVVSCDLPSGIHADTGKVLGAAVRAGVTVTFTCAKPGHYLEDGAEYTGELRVVDIGIPHQLLYHPRAVKEFTLFLMEYPSLPRRKPNSHKGDYGKVFLLAGSEGYTGAPVLAASAAVRSGAGLVHLGVPREIYPIVAVKCSSAMPFPLPEEENTILEKAKGCDAALIGPGLGRAPGTERLVHTLLEQLDIPVVLDADGINALVGHIDILDRRKALTVLTPHDGEFARLTGCPLPLEGRLELARDFARAHRCILVLKGHRTITAGPDGRAYFNTSGNPGMAKGGSGDVLSGILVSFLGQKQLAQSCRDDLERVAQAVWFHGAAGDRAARELGEYGMTPADLVDQLPALLRDSLETI